MKNTRSKSGSLTAVFFFGVLLLTYPLLSLFDRARIVFGLPLLYLYLFAAWAGLIGLVVLITREPKRERQVPSDKGT